MLTMEQIYNIRNMYKNEGKSLRQIARETKHDFETVKKYVEMEDFSPKVPVKVKRSGKTSKYRERVKQWLTDDLSAPPKQRHTAHRVYTRLKEEALKEGEEFNVSERAIRTLVADIRQEIKEIKNTHLPLEHPAGEAQVDFGKTEFYEKGILYEGHHLVVTFPHSDGKFVQLFKGENLECLMQGLKNVFEYLGKVPTIIRFDNMSTAVKRIKSYGEREVTDGFKRLMCHYGFKSNFCNPNSGHEKGSAENYVGTSRRNMFVPVPRIEDLSEYNKILLEKCSSDMIREHYKYERQVCDLFKEDLAAMNELPAIDFDACKFVFAKTDKYGRAKFETNLYSTSSYYGQSEVMLQVSAMSVRILNANSELIVEHPRLYGKNQESIKWETYLPLIAKRPKALKYTMFYEELPEETREFFKQVDLPDAQKALKFFAERAEKEGYEKAMEFFNKAITLGANSSESIQAAYRYIIDPVLPEANIETNVKFPKHAEYKVDLQAYMSLVRERGVDNEQAKNNT